MVGAVVVVGGDSRPMGATHSTPGSPRLTAAAASPPCSQCQRRASAAAGGARAHLAFQPARFGCTEHRALQLGGDARTRRSCHRRRRRRGQQLQLGLLSGRRGRLLLALQQALRGQRAARLLGGQLLEGGDERAQALLAAPVAQAGICTAGPPGSNSVCMRHAGAVAKVGLTSDCPACATLSCRTSPAQAGQVQPARKLLRHPACTLTLLLLTSQHGLDGVPHIVWDVHRTQVLVGHLLRDFGRHDPLRGERRRAKIEAHASARHCAARQRRAAVWLTVA